MYSKNFNPSKYKPIADLLGQIQVLEKGGSLWVNDLSREELHNTRWLLYDWLSHQGLKKNYRIRVLEGDLRISRLPSSSFDEELPPHLISFFERRLLHLGDEERVVAILKRKEEHFSLGEKEALFEEWKRVMK